MKARKNKLVVVLGMHRSGTSVITRGLQVMGIDLGNNLMPAANGNNEKGFWEDLDLNSLNIEMLAALRSDWHFLTPIQTSDISELQRQGYIARAVELLNAKTTDTSVFGFKDPRTAKLLPFWKEVFTQSQMDVSYVISVRHPLSVCKSLAKRDGFDFEKSYLLWLEHVINSLVDTEGEKRVLVDYDRLIQSPETELKRISEKLQLKIDPIELEKFKQEFLDMNLRHAVHQTNDLMADESAPPLIKEVYSDVINITSGNDDLENNILVHKFAQWKIEYTRQKAALTLVDKITLKMHQDLNEYSRTLAERDRQLEVYITGKEQQIAERDQRIAEQDQQLSNVYSSRAWRLATLIMRSRLFFIPQGSRREKIARALGNLILHPNSIFAYYKRRRFASWTKSPFIHSEHNKAITANFYKNTSKLQKEEALIRSSGLFNEAWYLSNNPDVANSKIDPLRHFLIIGGFEGRDPSLQFNSNWYLDTYKDVKRAGVNPLVHYLEFGGKEGRATRPDQEFQIASGIRISPESKLPSGAIAHRIALSYRKIRLFGGMLYSKREKIKRVVIDIIKNPFAPQTIKLISQLIPIVKSLSFEAQGFKGDPETLLNQLELNRARVFQVVPYYLDPGATAEVNIIQYTPKIAVHLHLYYPDMLNQCAGYLNNIPFHFDLYVSIAEKNDPDEIASFLKNQIHLLNKIVVKKTQNRGRDLAPLIIDFGKDLLSYDFIAHIHTKRSPHNPHLDGWFEDIMDTLFGSQSALYQIFKLLAADAKFIYPSPNEKILIDKSGWADNYNLAKEILPQLLGEKIETYPMVEFPQGSMFWAKSDALSKFLRFPLTYTDFPAEPIPADGTISHVLERLLLVSANHLPGRNYRIYLPKSTIKEAYYESQKDYSHSQTHKTVKVLSYYLPQFYPTPENDEWHGKGFTEWTKVRSTNPLFYGHYQQRVPHEDIGYYSLASSDVLKQQVELMKCSGVYGQIFYHYWFTGKLILEKPAQMLLADKSIEMPFCFCWANENWTRKWDGNENEILLGQKYSEQDAIQFINYLIPFFKDERYIKIDGRPILYIYRPVSIPNFEIYKQAWERVCAENSIKAPFVVAVLTRGAKSPNEHNMDAGCERVLHDWTGGNVKESKNELYPYWPINGSVLNYDKVADYYISQPPITDFTYFRSIIPSWDNTPRYGSEAFVIHKSTPEKFQEWLEALIIDAEERLPEDRRFVVINAWNEWAESAALEPDSRFGYAYLNSIGRTLSGIGFNDREYLHQAIPETTQVSIFFHDYLLQELQIDENLRKKMLFSIASSSVFSLCKVVFEQPQVTEWMSVFSGTVNKNNKNTASDYTLHIMGVCYPVPDAIENMLRMALRYDAGVVTPTHLNDPKFTHQYLLDRWETNQISTCMLLLNNGDKRSTKCCVDARIFISQSQPLQKSPNQKVSTVIRFSQSGKMKLLQNALYSLMAQIGCAVQPIIAAQDLTDDMLADLEAMLNKMSWDDNCHPIVRKYYSTEENRDLRSLMLNDSLKAVKTEYAAFLDYDDIMFHDAYSWLVERLRNTGKNASFGLIYSTVFNSIENKIRERQVVYNYGKSYVNFLKLNHTPIHGFLLNMSKINLDQIKYYEDMKYTEDYYLTLQIFTEDGTDWKSLQERKFIGDYYHYEDKIQTLAILDQEQRNKIISSPDYIESEDRINELKYRLLHGMPHGKM